jgi:hypothetical protein
MVIAVAPDATRHAKAAFVSGVGRSYRARATGLNTVIISCVKIRAKGAGLHTF